MPLFSGIYKRGAGLGPAIAFLYSAPAVDVLPMVYTFQLLGSDIGLAKAIGSIIFAAAVGLIMAFIYRKEEAEKVKQTLIVALPDAPEGKNPRQQLVFFGILIAILLLASVKNWVGIDWIGLGILLLLLGLVLWRWFTREDLSLWMRGTWQFVRIIVPWLVVGALAAAVIAIAFPREVVAYYVGGNDLLSCFISAVIGSLMYFCTLTEVPIVRAFMDLGMAKGPALALLLTGPAVSLPQMLVLPSIMGVKKTLVYTALVIVLATMMGFVFGLVTQ